jgi:hypothetical protein
MAMVERMSSISISNGEGNHFGMKIMMAIGLWSASIPMEV